MVLPKTPFRSCILTRAAVAALGLLLALEAPVAFAQSAVSWSAVKHRGAPPPYLDPALDAESVRAAIEAARTLSPPVARPEFVVGVDLGGESAVAVAGASGPDSWTAHVVRLSGEPVGSTVFDYAAGVIRDPDGRRVAWRAPGGDLERELRERWETLGAGGGIQGFFREVCREVASRPYATACAQLLVSQFKAGLLCLAILLALTLLCSSMDHIEMLPGSDPGPGGQGSY